MLLSPQAVLLLSFASLFCLSMAGVFAALRLIFHRSPCPLIAALSFGLLLMHGELLPAMLFQLCLPLRSGEPLLLSYTTSQLLVLSQLLLCLFLAEEFLATGFLFLTT